MLQGRVFQDENSSAPRTGGHKAAAAGPSLVKQQSAGLQPRRALGDLTNKPGAAAPLGGKPGQATGPVKVAPRSDSFAAPAKAKATVAAAAKPAPQAVASIDQENVFAFEFSHGKDIYGGQGRPFDGTSCCLRVGLPLGASALSVSHLARLPCPLASADGIDLTPATEAVAKQQAALAVVWADSLRGSVAFAPAGLPASVAGGLNGDLALDDLDLADLDLGDVGF